MNVLIISKQTKLSLNATKSSIFSIFIRVVKVFSIMLLSVWVVYQSKKQHLSKVLELLGHLILLAYTCNKTMFKCFSSKSLPKYRLVLWFCSLYFGHDFLDVESPFHLDWPPPGVYCSANVFWFQQDNSLLHSRYLFYFWFPLSIWERRRAEPVTSIRLTVQT